MIDVHENGFPHETLDPHYDERYRKTQGFNFRDRFNLVTRILKVSKHYSVIRTQLTDCAALQEYL